MNLPHNSKKNLLSAVLYCICAVAVTIPCSCQTISAKKAPPAEEQVDLSKMSKEERDNYLAIQRARKRANDKIKLEAANGKRNDPNVKKTDTNSDDDKWYKRLHSVEKRKRLRDDKPVLLNDNSSIFFWRKDSTPRSEKLHNQTIQERNERNGE